VVQQKNQQLYLYGGERKLFAFLPQQYTKGLGYAFKGSYDAAFYT
jgi:hypothetical protein